MTGKQKKMIMWFALFLIAIPMPFIIYFGSKMEKPPAFKSDCGSVAPSKMTPEQKERCSSGFDIRDVLPFF